MEVISPDVFSTSDEISILLDGRAPLRLTGKDKPSAGIDYIAVARLSEPKAERIAG